MQTYIIENRDGYYKVYKYKALELVKNPVRELRAAHNTIANTVILSTQSHGESHTFGELEDVLLIYDMSMNFVAAGRINSLEDCQLVH